MARYVVQVSASPSLVRWTRLYGPFSVDDAHAFARLIKERRKDEWLSVRVRPIVDATLEDVETFAKAYAMEAVSGDRR
jgi:hypothetical protein